MARCSTLLRNALFSLLLLFGVQAAVPHAHAADSHEAEICTGHLAGHGTSDQSHAGACPRCRTPNRSRMVSGGVTPCAAALPQPAFEVVLQPLQLLTEAAPIGSMAPRAPPLGAAIASIG